MVFKWAETHREPEYTNWQPREPNNNSNGKDEDCVYTYSLNDESFGWSDAPCDNTDDGNGVGHFALRKTDYEF